MKSVKSVKYKKMATGSNLDRSIVNSEVEILPGTYESRTDLEICLPVNLLVDCWTIILTTIIIISKEFPSLKIQNSFGTDLD